MQRRNCAIPGERTQGALRGGHGQYHAPAERHCLGQRRRRPVLRRKTAPRPARRLQHRPSHGRGHDWRGSCTLPLLSAPDPTPSWHPQRRYFVVCDPCCVPWVTRYLTFGETLSGLCGGTPGRDRHHVRRLQHQPGGGRPIDASLTRTPEFFSPAGALQTSPNPRVMPEFQTRLTSTACTRVVSPVYMPTYCACINTIRGPRPFIYLM